MFLDVFFDGAIVIGAYYIGLRATVVRHSQTTTHRGRHLLNGHGRDSVGRITMLDHLSEVDCASVVFDRLEEG